MFTDRFWEEKEEHWAGDLGIVYGSMQPYFGVVPDGTVGPLVGTSEEWLYGLDYDRWIAGGYPQPNGCVATGTPVVRVKLQTRLNIYEIGRNTAVPQMSCNIAAPQTISVPAFGAAALDMAAPAAIVTPTRRAMAAALAVRIRTSQLARQGAALRIPVAAALVSGTGDGLRSALRLHVVAGPNTAGADGLRSALRLQVVAGPNTAGADGLRSALRLTAAVELIAATGDGLRAALDLTAPATVSGGGGPGLGTPTDTCTSTGNNLPIDTDGNDTCPSGGNRWWSFTLTGSGTWHVTFTRHSGLFSASVEVLQGTCGSNTTEGSIGSSGGYVDLVQSGTFGYLIHVIGSMDATDYTVRLSAGAGP